MEIITPMQMYWIISLDGIKNVFELFSIVGTLVAIFLTAGCVASREKLFKSDVLIVSFFWAVGIVGILGAVLIPTTKQMAAILIVPRILNNEKVQQLPNQILDLGLEWLKELKPEKGND